MVFVIGVGLLCSILVNVFEWGYGIIFIVDYFFVIICVEGVLFNGDYYIFLLSVMDKSDV